MGCVGISVLGAAIKFLNGYLTILWRKLITEKIENNYFKDKNYYNILVLKKLVDNP